MPSIKGGAAIPVRQSTDNPRSGPAIPVYGYTAAPSDRPAGGGAALPVHVIADSELRANGGTFDLVGDVQALPVYDAPSGSGVQGGAPIPVYPVNPTVWGGVQSYVQKVTALIGASNLLRLWMLDEASGTTITDYSPNHANKASAYTGVTLGQPGPIAGHTAASFDGATSYANVWDAALNAGWNVNELTIFQWLKTSAWADATLRYSFRLDADATNNQCDTLKLVAANSLQSAFKAGGIAVAFGGISNSTTNWFSGAMTISKSGNVARQFLNGTQSGADQVITGQYVGGPSNGRSFVGAASSVPASVWSGGIAAFVIATRALSPTEVSALSAIVS